MKKSKEIIGLPVISIREGKELGVVKQLIVDAAAGTIAALNIDDGKWYLGAKVLPFSAISGLGEYAVTINSETDIKPIADSPDFDRLLNLQVNVIGAEVLTRGGNILGTVNEFLVDEHGKISQCTLSNECPPVEAQQVITYGKQYVIIQTNQPAAAATVVDTLPQEEPPSSATDLAVPTVEPVTPAELEENPEPESDTMNSEPDALAKMFEEKQRKYMLGKKASRQIETETGIIIIEQGAEITEAVLQKAKLAGKFVELSMSIY